MITLKKYIRNSFCCIVSFCIANKANSQDPKLFINGKHEYIKYSSRELFYNDRVVNSFLNDSLYKTASDVFVRLRVVIGHDTLWSDTFNYRKYFYLTEIITGFSNNLKRVEKEVKDDEELFMKKNDESYLPFILKHYNILDSLNKKRKGLKYFIIKFDNSIWIMSGYKYSSYW